MGAELSWVLAGAVVGIGAELFWLLAGIVIGAVSGGVMISIWVGISTATAGGGVAVSAGVGAVFGGLDTGGDGAVATKSSGRMLDTTLTRP